MTEIPTKNLSNRRVRWFPSSFIDRTRPSLLFRYIAALLVIGWMSTTGWIVLSTTTLGSPDEAANQLFIQHLATTGQYRVDEHTTAEVLKSIHPRSTAVKGQFLASGSFVGLVQVGAVLQKIFSSAGVRMFTPLLSLAGLWAMFFVFRRFWSRWWALFAVALIALHPAFFEFATLPYLHNGAFVAGLLITGWGLLRLLERPTTVNAILTGAAFGLALLFRPVEVLWTAPAIAIVLIARKLWRELGIVALLTIVFQLPWLIANQSMYGSLLSSGYTPNGLLQDESGAVSLLAPAKSVITPPGGQWSWHWLSSVWWYYILFLPSWSLLSIIALGRYLKRKFINWQKILKLTLICVVGVFPFVYYGTWNLYPQLPASVNGALASYVRYWIPLYIVMTPGVIIILRSFSRRWICMAAGILLLITQVVLIWSHPVSGLAARFRGDRQHAATRQYILTHTPSDAVVFAGPADKYILDQRFAVYQIPSVNIDWQLMHDVVAQRPTYVFANPGYITPSLLSAAVSHGIDILNISQQGNEALYLMTVSTL